VNHSTRAHPDSAMSHSTAHEPLGGLCRTTFSDTVMSLDVYKAQLRHHRLQAILLPCHTGMCAGCVDDEFGLWLTASKSR